MSKTKAYIGIDPGASGAICLLVPDNKQALFLPTTEDPAETRQWILDVNNSYDLVQILIEKVRPMQKGGLSSAWTFGYNVGTINTIVATTALGYDLVLPKEWQKGTGVVIPPKTKPAQRKKITEAVVNRLYPGTDIYGPKGGLLDGRSDALMIAHYCMLKYK